MYYQQSIAECFTDVIGSDGVTRADFEAQKARLEPIAITLRDEIAQGKWPLLTPYDTKHPALAEIFDTAKQVQSRYKRMVVLGTGGSTLCGQTLACSRHAALHHIHVDFWENVAPYTFEQNLNHISTNETIFLAISKSGGTLETLAQTYACIGHIEQTLGREQIREHMMVISDPGDNPIRRIATHYDIPVLDHEASIGGRFSLLTNVGLLPAAVAGLEIEEVLAGAEDTINEFTQQKMDSNTLDAAAMALCLQQQGCHASILMSYQDRYRALTRWFCQIHAESLGKHEQATTPIAATGTIDQHSQLQLWLEGPNDKYYTLLLADRAGRGNKIFPENIVEGAMEMLSDHSIGDVITASQEGTRESLIHHKRPVRTIRFASVNEGATGAFAMQLILETILIARAQQINPFDQPAVEDGKARTRDMLTQLY